MSVFYKSSNKMCLYIYMKGAILYIYAGLDSLFHLPTSIYRSSSLFPSLNTFFL